MDNVRCLVSISSGTLQVNAAASLGTTFSVSGSTVESAAATLGTSSLSVSNGTLQIGTATAIETVNAAAATFTGGILTFQLFGTSVGTGGSTGYSQLSVAGNVDLGSSTSLSYNSAALSIPAGTVLTVVTCTGTLSGICQPAGQVDDLHQCSPFTVNYTGTSVTLTKLAQYFYVDANWASDGFGTPVTVGTQTLSIGSNAFGTIRTARY